MPRQLQPSRACVSLVKTFEGLRLVAGRLETGGWTIGYGHTLTAREGARVSEADAEALLIYDLRHEAERIRPLIFSPLAQNEFDALLSFAFNVGDGSFQSSEVLKRLNEGDHLGAASALERWRAADFEGERLVIDGLVRRRAAEKALFLTPSDGHAPVPTPVLRPLLDLNEGDPVDARAGRAVRLVAALDGEASLSRIDEAAEGLSALLAARFRGAPEEPAPFELPQASDAAPLEDAEPYPGPETAGLEPPASLAESPAPEAAISAGIFPHALTPEPEAESEPELVADLAALETPEARTFAEEARAPEQASTGRRAPVFIGLLGLVLFGAALFSMVSDRASALNLAVGLLGALCLAYASANLMLPRLDRPTE